MEVENLTTSMIEDIEAGAQRSAEEEKWMTRLAGIKDINERADWITGDVQGHARFLHKHIILLAEGCRTLRSQARTSYDTILEI